MDFEEFSYDSVEVDGFDYNYYGVTLLEPLVVDFLIAGEPAHTVFLNADEEFAKAYFLASSKLLVFQDEKGDEYSIKVNVSLG